MFDYPIGCIYESKETIFVPLYNTRLRDIFLSKVTKDGDNLLSMDSLLPDKIEGNILKLEYLEPGFYELSFISINK